MNCGAARRDPHRDPRWRAATRARVERIGAAAPLRRPGEPEEVARAILCLASDEASYTTGSILDVTGGR